jgi:hypothetical protein
MLYVHAAYVFTRLLWLAIFRRKRFAELMRNHHQ